MAMAQGLSIMSMDLTVMRPALRVQAIEPHSVSCLQEGWLSSSGSLQAKDAGTVEVAFNKFWVDFGSSKLRATLSEGEAL